MSAAALAQIVGTTEATVSNWLNDKVQPDHVKAIVLLKIAEALSVSPGWLLTGKGARSSSSEAGLSHPLKLEVLTVALELADQSLRERGLELPPPKRAELTALLYELLDEGMPQAKVLRFARAANG
jgi:transcriptional regulator with XRE-family HTH domain